MADTKISELAAASTLDGTEVLPVVQAATTKKATVNQIRGGAGGAHPDLATHDALGLATDAALTAHAATAHAGDHPDGDHATLATSASVTSAISTHEAAGNPHATYATDADLTAHAAAADPHTGYALETLLAASAMGVVNHGATAGTARPTGYAVVHWIGSVTPTNAVNGDLWTDTA